MRIAHALTLALLLILLLAPSAPAQAQATAEPPRAAAQTPSDAPADKASPADTPADPLDAPALKSPPTDPTAPADPDPTDDPAPADDPDTDTADADIDIDTNTDTNADTPDASTPAPVGGTSALTPPPAPATPAPLAPYYAQVTGATHPILPDRAIQVDCHGSQHWLTLPQDGSVPEEWRDKAVQVHPSGETLPGTTVEVPAQLTAVGQALTARVVDIGSTYVLIAPAGAPGTTIRLSLTPDTYADAAFDTDDLVRILYNDATQIALELLLP